MTMTVRELLKELHFIVEDAGPLRRLFFQEKARILSRALTAAQRLDPDAPMAAIWHALNVGLLIDQLVGTVGKRLVQRGKSDYERSSAITRRFIQTRVRTQIEMPPWTARQESIKQLRSTTVMSVQGQIRRQIEQRLAVAEAMQLPNRKVGAVLEASLDGQWWIFERAARTEASFTVNQAQADLVRVNAKQLPGLSKRWTEMVDDTGRPLDKKVAPDSLAMHGQIVAPDEKFIMPPDERAPAKMVGKSWDSPPNRPNDRAVVLPWMKEWGIPGWRWKGRRIPA